MSTIRVLLLSTGILFASSACRVKAPTLPEQRELLARGSFGSGAPPWVSGSVVTGTGVAVESSGYIPERFQGPKQLKSDAGDSPSLALDEEVRRKAIEARVRNQYIEERREAVAAAETGDSSSALGKIASRCPGVEDSVREALVTTDINERIGKYEVLTQQCGSSAQLWIWLGRDYLQANNYPSAMRALEQAQLLEPGNEEVVGLMQQVRQSEVVQQPPLRRDFSTPSFDPQEKTDD